MGALAKDAQRCQRLSVRIAIYDLDRTLTRKPTFTPFLLFAARRLAPWRVLLLPVWIAAMLGYRAGLYSRTALKRFGMHLMTGAPSVERLHDIGKLFALQRIRQPGLMAQIMQEVESDRAAQSRMVIATAAFELYAHHFAAELQFDAVIATRWDGQDIPGGNCYGEAKKARVLEWLEHQGIDHSQAQVRFVSDSFADSPLLEIADEPIFVTDNASKSAKARARGWQVMAGEA